MLISAKVWQDDDMWISECESLCVVTQGESRNDALEMLSDALSSLYPKFKFKADWMDEAAGMAYIEPESIAEALGIMIERNRNDNDLTLAEFAELVGYKNHNSVYAYERATREASFSKVEALMEALGKNIVVTLRDKAG